MNERSIERTLGRMEATSAQILEELKRYRQENKEIRRQLGEVDRKQEAAERERAAMLSQLALVKKNTEDFNKWKERGVGAIMLVSIAAALVGGGLGATWHKIVEVFR